MWKLQTVGVKYLLDQPLIFQGENAIYGLSNIPGSRVAVIYGASFDEVTANIIRAIFKKKSLFLIERSWGGEPDLLSISQTIHMLEECRPDVIVAIGGGSIIDGSKLCRLFYEYPFFELGSVKLDQLVFSTRFVAVPTTIGSGAECSSAAVYINEEKEKKEMLVCHSFRPECVVLDPYFISNSPIELIISSGVDAMAHIIEGYVSLIDNGLANINAEIGLGILFNELNKNNLNEMQLERIQYAGYLGGLVQNHCIVGAAHGIAHQLSMYGFSHSVAVAILLPAVIRVNCKNLVVKEKYNTLCVHAGIESVEALIQRLYDITNRVGIRKKSENLIKILQSKIEDKDFIYNIINDQGGKGNPVVIDKSFINEIIGVL